jgi:hypothetical protein
MNEIVLGLEVTTMSATESSKADSHHFRLFPSRRKVRWYCMTNSHLFDTEKDKVSYELFVI